MFARPYVLPVVALFLAMLYLVMGHTDLASGVAGIAFGLTLWAMGTTRAIRPLMWFGAGIAGFSSLLVARLLFFG